MGKTFRTIGLFICALLIVKAATAVGNDPVFRIKEYHIDAASNFTGTTFNLTLNQDLVDNYFILVRGSRKDSGGLNHSQAYARIFKVPGGKGDLAASTANNIITLQRHQTHNEWEGVITVVECLAEEGTDGFKLLDAKDTLLDSAGGSFTSSTNWTTLANVVPYGGYRGGGVQYTSNANAGKITSAMTRIYPSETNTINWVRHAGGDTLVNTKMTTFIVEWGSNWTVQHAFIDGNKGGSGADATNEYATATINQVTRANTWVWGTGNRTDAGIGDCAEAVLATLGDGKNINATETKVAVGSEYNDRYYFDVYVLSHASISVEYKFKADGDTNLTDKPIAITPAVGNEKFAWVYNTVNGTGTAFPRPQMWARFTASNEVTISRGYNGQNFVAWVQAINLSGIKYNANPDAPYISITGSQYLNHRLGATFTNPNAAVYAADNSVLQDPLAPDNSINVLVPGEQALRYNYNGASEITITVNIESPTFEIQGTSPYNYQLNVPFSDPKAIFKEPDGTVISEVSTSTLVNTFKPGTRTIQYSVVDSISNQTFTTSRQVVIGDTLLSRWRFDKGGRDDTKANAGTVVGAEAAKGKFSTALQFDGVDDYVDLGDVAAMDQPSTFTISLWFKRTANNGGTAKDTNHGVNNVLIGQASRAVNDNLEIGTDGTKIEVYIDSYGGLDTTKTIEAGIQNNVWYNLMVAYNAGTVKVYLDGVKKATWTGFGTRLDSSAQSKLSLGISRLKLDNGTQSDQMWGDFTGLMDDVRIYTSVFPDSVISRMATSGTLRTWTRSQFRDKLKEDSRYSALATKVATKKDITVAQAQDLIDSDSFDADGDGRSNLIEYAFGCDSLGADEDEKNRKPKRKLDRAGGYFQITFVRRRIDVATDLTYYVERSTDLVNWTETGVTLVESEDLGDGLEEVTYKSDEQFNQNDSPKNQYLRIRVESN
jgi:hypothetical protein